MKNKSFNGLFDETLESRTLTKEQREKNGKVLKSEFKKVKKQRNIALIALGAVIVILLLLLCMLCCCRKDKKVLEVEKQELTTQVKTLTFQKDSTKWLLDDERDKGCYVKKEEVVRDGQKGILVTAIERCSCRPGDKELFIPEKVRYIKKEVTVSCDSLVAQNEALRIELGSLIKKIDDAPVYGKGESVPDTLKARVSIGPEGEKPDFSYYQEYTFTRSFNPELEKLETQMIVESSGFFTQDVPDYITCFNQTPNPMDRVITLNLQILEIDHEKREKARKQRIWAKVARGFGFGMMTYLRHSDAEHAITYNGIDPYDSANPYQEKNISDRENAWFEVGMETLGIASYVVGEGLEVAGDINHHNSFKVKSMQITYEPTFDPANEYQEYTKYPNWK